LKPKFSFIDSELSEIKKNHLLRNLKYGTINGGSISIQGKDLINLCSNDYLGIPPTNLNMQQLQSSSRLVSGNDDAYKDLEKKLARHKSQQSSLVYPTGYMANLGAISTVAKKGDLILSDELNHASIIESCKLTGAKILIYKHNDMEDLHQKLKHKSKNKFVITEGIFSMDGDFSNLKELTEIAEKNNIITILDDAHGDFVVGKDGKGTADYFAVSKKIDLYISSLSKGLGSFGGYVASEKNVIDLNINKSKTFIYTSALPAVFVKYSLRRLEANREKYQKKLETNIRIIRKGLEDIGYQIDSKTHIIPIIIGSEKMAMKFGEYLLKNGLYVQPIRYPTVPRNKARVRISITSWLTKKDIQYSLEVLEKAFQRFLK
jgi:glycine C-acetyltransferase